ncbi:MAG: hypothetical protein H8D92_00040 [Pelagibacteraceae bacterium]|jgi:hypothetical protein|nr:hypothetical protein [Pelagibacteraceae bacterium]
MATKLDNNSQSNDLTKKLWEKHQSDEYTHVDNYKEAICINCFKRDASAATLVDICGECAGKRGREPLLAKVVDKMYGLCFFCGEHKFHIEQINGRLCRTCHRRVANVTKEYNKKGGMFGADPFWQSMRKKHGKDWRIIMGKNLGNRR